MAQKIQPTPPALAPLVPFQVRYSELTFGPKLGGGGFGDVFKGTWRHTAVAIKKLKIELLASEGLEEFKKEATLMSQLRHPNIVYFYKACIEPGNYCIVMEYCEKGSLYHWLRTPESTDLLLRKRIALEVARGLGYLHAHQIIHRDLKSLNILLDATLKAKLADFGLSKLKVETSLTSAGPASIVGTLRWNPPELLSGDVMHHSKKTDMYSFGMVLWEIASRTIPFVGQLNEQIVGMWIMQGRKEKIPEETPASLKALIERCRDASEKRPTAEEAIQGLEEKEIPAAASPPPSLLVALPPRATPPLSLATLAPSPSEMSAPPSSPVPPGEKEYQQGSSFKKSGNVVQAFNHYQKAAEQGNALAQYNLGVSYYNGQGVAQNDKEAVKWYQKAAEQGNACAQHNLGSCYLKGQGVAQDDKEAVKWYRKAAEQGDADAQTNLGVCYKKGLGLAQDDKEAVKWYRIAAEQGNAAAQTNLGICYQTGQGVAQDDKEAVKWYRKAAEQGNAAAQTNLGLCYFLQGCIKTARAAELTDIIDGTNLRLCDHPQGESPDFKEAIMWYRKAAEQGDTCAQNNLGNCYRSRLQGMPHDYNEAIKWYLKAAEQGNPAARNKLGMCYQMGQGVAKDRKEAAKWYQKAAEQGRTAAQTNFGICNYDGEGMQSYKEAINWYKKP